jgi:hypothetical protein
MEYEQQVHRTSSGGVRAFAWEREEGRRAHTADCGRTHTSARDTAASAPSIAVRGTQAL